MKISIYAGAPIERVLRGHPNRSGRLNAIAERYVYVVDRDCPALTEAEWSALCDVSRGDFRLLWAETEYADGLAEKWGIDAHALAVRLRDASAGRQVAVAEILERVRAHTDAGARILEALNGAGARIAAGGASRAS